MAPTSEQMERSRADTEDHIRKVQAALDEVTARLTVRAVYHDASKLQEPELSGYAQLHADLAEIRYGTPEYRAALDEAKETIAHHYAHNTHHPEHWPNGIADMSLLDVIEMFCDWYAAGQRTKQGSLKQSLEVNRTRFGADPTLAQIFENTRKELGWE
jgi:hypothetical protein